ncbi:hypothetical protein [Xenorhabdus littoralis]|uniref:hypothetical protein n=1 Tax=Xenorhabdus littoralis TaxID=2582835 RepID=UPI0029E7E2FA|nr:hypothetical protein [Xenorhabdus sp. psl]MDX7990495.1 hypothetical protein [Xenorhabdus sp. psl]
MPFYLPFRREFHKGDLIYGLVNEIRKYIYNNNYFKDSITHYEHKDYPPALMSDYFIPLEWKDANDFASSGMELEDPEDIKDLKEVKIKFQYMKNDIYRKHEESFFRYLKINNKYRSVMERTDYSRQIIGRKCKGAVSWVSINNDKLIKNTHIHFILDGINIEELISKYDSSGDEDTNINKDKNKDVNKEDNEFVAVELNNNRYKNIKGITGIELRWIFRNRANPQVANKVQFWKNGLPTPPPWVGNQCLIWDKYALHLEVKEKEDEDRYDGLSRLFRIF